MPADLFDGRFASHRVAAWHNLGVVTDEVMTAVQALDRMRSYDVTLEPLLVPTLGGGTLASGYNAIVRHPTAEDDEYRTFGIVGSGYHLITPQSLCRMWDASVGAPVETIGALGRGEQMFLTTKLPTFSVNGDEVDTYLIAVNPMTGGAAAQVRIAPVRVVCQNTLAMSKRQASESYSVTHDANAETRMGDWLRHAYQQSSARVLAIQTAFVLLAGMIARPPMTKAIIDAAYPLPRRPRPNAPDQVMVHRTEQYEQRVEWALNARSRAGSLFGGSATGADTPAFDGTLWGVYNSVTELENYRRMHTVQSASSSVLFGDRADAMGRAYQVAMDCAQHPEDFAGRSVFRIDPDRTGAD